MSNSGETEQAARLRAITRELEAMSDWELERGLASSLGFDDDRRRVADRILRNRYAGSERSVALWILAIAAGAGIVALLE
ncbi:MAG TPA: hypothetical protein VFK91_05130 [Methyloceanibacter sp.]|nr:hypothetical protein [Methyloceanibacter sp.]